MVLRFCKHFFRLYALYFFNICCIFANGKWYSTEPVPGPLLTGKTEFENEIKKGLRNHRNFLCDEELGIFYMNQFFPCFPGICCPKGKILQLGDIFFNKGMFLEGELKQIQQISSGNDVKTEDLDVGVLKKFIRLGIEYLEAFNLSNESGILSQIISGSKDFTEDKAGIDYLVNSLNDATTMRPVWDCMHTERLLIFDKYYNPKTKALEAPEKALVFVSYYDMCEVCETLMEAKLSGMGGVREEDFRGENYKILVGSFHEYKGSRRRDSTESLLLKVPLSATVIRSIPTPTPQPNKRFKPVVVVTPGKP